MVALLFSLSFGLFVFALFDVGLVQIGAFNHQQEKDEA